MSARDTLVFDSSALIGYIKNFEYPVDVSEMGAYAAQQHYLELWEKKLGIGEEFDVAIPDHVFYEVTGILPISLKYLRNQAQAHVHAIHNAPDEANKEKAAQKLQVLIDMYAEASPRMFLRGSHGQYDPSVRKNNANQLRFLLTLATHYPDTIRDTEVGKHYCARLRAEYHTMRPVPKQEVREEINALRNGENGSWLHKYIPSFGDVQHALGDEFAVDGLRFHANQAWLMDFITEQRYRGMVENKNHYKNDFGINPRVITVADFVGRTLKNEPLDSKKASTSQLIGMQHRIHDNFEQWVTETVEKAHPGKQPKGGALEKARCEAAKQLLRRKITIGDVRRLTGDEVTMFRSKRREAGTPTTIPLDEALAPTKTMLGQYVFSGVLPGGGFRAALTTSAKSRLMNQHDLETALHKDGILTSEKEERLAQLDESGRALEVMANALGYQTDAWANIEDKVEKHNVRVQHLTDMGFFERELNVADLVALENALALANLPTNKLSKVVDALPTRLCHRWKEINAQSIRETGHKPPPDDKMPGLGTPIEKIFTEGVISGVVSQDEFFHVLSAVKGEEPDTQQSVTSDDGKVALIRDADGYRIRFACEGIAVRTGPRNLQPVLERELERKADVSTENGQKTFTMQLDDFLQVAREHRYRSEDMKPGKVLEGLFFLENLMLKLCNAESQKKAPDHASGLLRTAIHVLGDGGNNPEMGEDRLVQLQKDFESFHERRFTGEANQVRPVASIMAADQRNHRMFRRNLGEVAVTELGARLADGGKRAWLVANDSDIMPGHLDASGKKQPDKPEFHGIVLKPHVLRQHSYFHGVVQTLNNVNMDAQKAEHFQLVPTDQWLNTLASKNHTPGHWTKNKQPFNRNWTEQIDDQSRMPISQVR